jgi:hypothetical protein
MVTGVSPSLRIALPGTQYNDHGYCTEYDHIKICRGGVMRPMPKTVDTSIIQYFKHNTDRTGVLDEAEISLRG